MRLIFLIIKIIFAAILSGLIVMRFFFFYFFLFFEKNGENVILGHTAFCIVVFQQISVYL